MKKIFILALLTLSLAACSGGKGEVTLSGKLKSFSAEGYTISLPEECQTVDSEITGLSAQYEGCSVTVASMPADQATICDDRKQFTQAMDAMGYDITVEDYTKGKLGGMDAYTAEYALDKSDITQITYLDGETAYIVTYLRPQDIGDEADEVFLDGIKTLELED